jgi:hypothetical protein
MTAAAATPEHTAIAGGAKPAVGSTAFNKEGLYG